MAEAANPAWRWMIAGEVRAFPARFILAAIAIAVGVALAFAVHIINRSAAEAFGQAVRTASGEADLQVLGRTSLGFDEALYPKLMALPEVADASPVVMLRAEIGRSRPPITLLGIDILRAANVSPSLVGVPRLEKADADALFDTNNIFLSQPALAKSGAAIGDQVPVRANGEAHVFTVAGELPGVAAGQAIAVIDISAAQWRFDELGTLHRIDLALAQGVSPDQAREAMATILPTAARIGSAEEESRRGSVLSRAYRINLDMLALVALLTGGFLVYSAQSLSVTRRLRQFALLRTLGLERRALSGQLIGEGLVLGLAGSALGLGLGYLLAGAAMRFVGGDLGAGYFAGAAPELSFAPLAAFLFFGFGVAVAVFGSWAPARAAARIAPAEALRNAGGAVDPRHRPRIWPAALLMMLGALAALLPPVNRLPIFGYLSVGLLLAGGVAAMPWLARTLLMPIAKADIRFPSFDLALKRLLGAPGQTSTALGGIVASTGLMIAMAVMVTSFRGAVEDWLTSFLDADIYIGAASNEPLFGPDTQNALAGVPGVAGISFGKSLPVTLDPELPNLQLIIRPIGGPGYALPLIEQTAEPVRGIPIWVSEPAARLYGLEPGDPVDLPIGAEPTRFHVAGIWRDYARQQGAIMIDSDDYVAITGDRSRNEAVVDLEPGASTGEVREALRERLPANVAARARFTEPRELRAQALRLFDSSFAITYVLEAIAILIGLAGVAATISAETIARIREFGMLRHLGMTRRQIIAMLASEGALLGIIGIAAGIAVGIAVSQILIHVINPQSFNWTMTTQIPFGLIGALAAALVVTSAGTAAIAGRRAVSRDAVLAVSEDW